MLLEQRPVEENRQISPPRSVGITSLSLAVHHCLVIVGINKYESYFDVLRAIGKAGSRADPEDWIGVARRSIGQPDYCVDPGVENGLVPEALDGLWGLEQG